MKEWNKRLKGCYERLKGYICTKSWKDVEGGWEDVTRYWKEVTKDIKDITKDWQDIP